MDTNISCPTCHEKNPLENNYCRVCGALLKQSLVDLTQTCPFCKNIVADMDYSCPTCGRKIREKPLSTSALTQIGIYLLSFLLPPLGLVPGFRYLRQNDQKRKIIGIIALILTAVSLILGTIFIVNFINTFNDIFSKQLQQLTF